MLPFVLIVIAFLVDRLSKWWAADFFAEHGDVTINQFLTLRETYNRGVAFGMFQGIGPLVGWLTIAVLAAMIVYIARTPRRMVLLRSGLSLIVGGALGNLVDRITVGQVLDFVQTPLRSGIFNGADVMINLGMVLALVGSFRQPRTDLEDDLADSPDPPAETGEIEAETE